MQLTTRGRYAVTAMLDIALEDGKVVTLTDIASRQGISKTYLEQIFVKLRSAGLVESVRGPGGGYYLSHPLDRITLEQIMRATHEKVDTTRCQGKKNCRRGKPCLTHKVWDDLNQVISQFLQSVTLAHLVKDEKAASATISFITPDKITISITETQK